MRLRDLLPPHLSERLRDDGRPSVAGEFVLYWMHAALRAHENPALDAALLAAEALGLPLLVYQGLSERYEHASDRHHTFILEGARDVHGDLARRRIGSALHVERRGHRGPALRRLAERAALVITEDLPTEPALGFVERLAAASPAPVARLDTACVVPMGLCGARGGARGVDRMLERAFAFRAATAALRAERLRRPWPEVPDPAAPFVPRRLPFAAVDPALPDLADLVGACDIDHAVGPVPGTRGGSAAGYARWDEFRRRRLARYAADRNDALRDGVSRMSPYLHYGMVSPLRLAREAAAAGGSGAEKLLDELLIWRELAYAFCFHRRDHATIQALPAWARETLAAHQRDARPAILDWEALARGRSGAALWDAAQRSLLRHGELHNNLRMTWGKALLSWTRDAEAALALLLDLNNRYALDGRDPSSYGGILWCLGLFDRPFTPPSPVYGTVRTRPIEQHAARLDGPAYEARVARPPFARPPRVAVVGAGLSGLLCARTLLDHGLEVAVFDKARAPGGRAATRRAEPDLRFDHGAQYFTVRDPRSAPLLRAWLDRGLVAEWRARVVRIEGGAARPEEEGPTRYVAVPGMSALGRHLAAELPLTLGTRITSAERAADGWHLGDEGGSRHGPFDRLVVALPAPQAQALLPHHRLGGAAGAVIMEPCWAVMLALPGPVALPWDGAFLRGSPLSWVARDSSKPGRGASPERLVLHGSPAWSAAHLEDPAEEVLAALTAALHDQVPGLPPPMHGAAHRWRYSIAADREGVPGEALFDAGDGLALCGDWLAGGRVEGALRSGVAAAGFILRDAGR